LFGASEAMQDAIGGSAIAMRRPWYQPRLAQARAALGEDAFTAAWAAGQALTVDLIVAETTETAERLRAGDTPVSGRSTVKSAGATPHDLSPREMDVLRLLVAGQTDREIGATLFISPRTAQGHVARVFSKLGVNTRTAAVTSAFQLGLLNEATPPP
jgi:DNA-binding CsgD family transcriptional regulator